MAFTYTTLQTKIADFLNRSDLTSIIPTFIELAEADFNRRIRHHAMEVRANAVLNSQYFVTPVGWLENVRLRLTDDGTYPLEMTSNSQIADMRRNSNDTPGRPQYFSFVDGTYDLFPTPDAAYNAEVIYYKKIDPLSASTATNFILDDHPDAYLYSSLSHSAPYLSEDARMQIWGSLAERAINDVNAASERAKYSSAGITMKKRGLAPARRRHY